MRLVIGSFAVLSLLTLLGCSTTQPNTRPPKEPMVYRTAPDDPAYSRPLEYPKETMEQDPLIKKAKNAGITGLNQRPGQASMGRPGGVGGTGF
ncbi:MAG: hypothetical protein EBV06_16515 [Planctomycetia bacterium]|nr:hypothetical protein [Planctomycetia bacterium]